MPSMFAAPPRMAAELFASLPDELRVRDDPVVRSGVVRDSLLEGPSFDLAGNLYCVDLPYGRIFRIDPGGRFELVTRYAGHPNGSKLHANGLLYIADHSRGLLTLDPRDGTLTTLLDSAWGEPFKGLNDLHFGANGDLYFTDQGSSGLEDPTGRVFRLSADGRLELLIDNVPSPNGIVLAPDGKTLYVAVTRANAVWRLPLAAYAPGRIKRVGTYIQLSGGTGPDGLAMSADGHLLVAHVGLGAVWVFDPWGEPVLRIDAPAGRGTTNLAFGGPGRQTLYITESASGSILRVRLPFAGMTLYSGV